MIVPGSEEEVAVLGAILVQGSCYQDAAAHVVEADFFREEHRLIWRAMAALEEKGDRIDPVSVASKLKEKRCLTRAGGSLGISAMMDSLFDVQNVAHYAKHVKSASEGRELKRIGKNLMLDEIKPEQRMDIAFSALSDLNQRSGMGNAARVGDIAGGIMSDIVDGNGFDVGIKMGFTELDEPLSGLNKESLIVLAARPSIGKSAFSLQVALNVAKRNVPVLYVSPEMSNRQLTKRLLSMMSDVPYSKIMNSKGLTEKDMLRLKEAREQLDTIPLTIDDSSDHTVASVKLAARSRARAGLGLLIVDYLQLLCEGDDSKEAVTIVSKGLKAIAKDLNIPVWAVSQLSRSIVYRDSQRPTLSDLRGSGQIEQDADAVLMLWKVAPKKNPDKIEIFIEKHRNGPLGQTTLNFDKETTKFTGGEW